MARLDANLAAIRVVRALQAEGRAATHAEQEILARWSGWGAVAAVFAENEGKDRAFAPARQQLRTLLTDKEYAAARRNTINAHYTSPALTQAMWDGLAAFGFTGGRVLEPGCGSGNFIGLAPPGTAMAGIELDPVTAHVAAALYPHAQIRSESFADTQLPEGSFDAAIGNVPFGKIHLNDSRYNPGRRHPIHTHFMLKSAAMVRPGGWIALITSHYTLDGTGEDAVAARRQLAGLGELAAAARLPAAAHRRTAGTDVVTDVLVIRRFEDGEQPPPGEPAWIQTVPVDVDGVQIPVNRYFADHPGMVLGDLAAGGARRADDLRVIAPAGSDVATGLAQALAGAAAGRAALAPHPATPPPAMDRPPEGYQQARPDGTFARITNKVFVPFDPPGGPAGQAEVRALLGLRDAAMALLDAELATTEDAGLVDDLRADLNVRYDAYVAAYGPVNRHTRQVRLRNTLEGRALRDQLLAEGHARFTGGKLEISDPAVRDKLIAPGHATVTETGELRFGRTREARAERQRLLDSGQARAHGGTLTLTETGRARVLENAADLHDAVTVIRARPSQGGFRNDPFAVRVLALEKYDPETGTARKNDIMRHRVLLPRPAVEHAEDPEDALAICMDRHARVRLDVIAALLGTVSEQDARDRLGTLVYHDPVEGRLVPAQEYLSGDVRAKLRQAAAAAADDPAYQANVEALTKVIPPDLGPAEIEARLGAVFITPAEVQQFLRETLSDASVTVALAGNGTWLVSGGDRHSVAATITWGTADRDALSLAEHLLNRRGPVEVTRKDGEGRTWTDEEATQAARGKQAELSDRFAGWAWEDLDRAGEICRRYNDAFNSIVLRSYDEVQLSLPGVNRDISLYWWQKAAIARMIYEPTAGLFHDMGAGKTLEQIIGVMEQKRLGLIRKPVICVKNHLLDQFRDEFLWAYPQARILCADTSNLEGEGRRQFIARCAAENPDAIIMTRGAFESIPLTPEGHEAYLDYLKQMFTVHAEAVTESVKDEETLLAEFEEKLRAYFDPDYQKDEDEDEPDRKRRKRKVEQDPAMCWEQMGIDYACVDESQDFNNLWVPSDEPGMAIGFTHRAIDLEMKLHAIRRRYGRRACALATGTPVTNKIPQFYVLQRYLRPERLQAAGFAGYAPWAATYTEPEQRLEMKADGRFGMVTRMRLINFPELLLDLHFFGDFKDADDIGLPRPAIRGGKPEIRGNPAVTELVDYQATLPERYREAKGGKKHKGDDTVVAVIGDGFRAAQDLRLVKANHGERPSLTDEPQKIDHIADDVYAEWLAHRDDVYPGEDGQPDPVTGSLQLVFCNEGVPSADWNLYDELRNLLIERGMPRTAIRFIHDATDARKKAALFAACNAGHVAVLIGSTEKMGVGTNVQRRCIGVQHVHPHWRPDYDAQEDARARRPGNLNTEVFVKKWITEGSFDTIRAQACERKSVFLRVIKHRDTSIRSIEAPDDDTVSYAEIAAVGAGEPRLIQKAQLESELQQLARAQRRHVNNQNALKVAEQQARASITAAEQTICDIDAAAARLIPTSGDAFSMTVDGTAFTARREAGDHLISCLRDARARVPAGECHTRTVGRIGGFQLDADLANDGREDSIVVRLADLPGGVVRLDHRKLPGGIGLVTRLENCLTGLDKLLLEQQAVLDRQRQEITRAQSAIGAPFPQQDALLAAKRALDTLVTELRGDKDEKNADPATTAAGPGGPRHDDNRDTRLAAETRPAHADGHAKEDTNQASVELRHDHADDPVRSGPGRIRQPASPDDSSPSQQAPATASAQPARPDAARPAAPARPSAPAATPAQPPASAPEPAGDPADGLVIEHHQQGTLVHGTEKDDQQMRRLLREQGFRWSRNLNAWYLPRPWTFSTRNNRVTGLTASLRQARRSFTMRTHPPVPSAADGSPPELVPAGEPYTELRQAQHDGDYEQALALLDEAELLDPDHGLSWDAGRDQVRGAMRQAKSPQPQDQDSLGSPAPAADAHAGTGDAAQAGVVPDAAASAAAPVSDHARSAPSEVKEAPGHAAVGGSPQKPGQRTRDAAPAADGATADEIVAAARRRAEARDQVHVPIDYARANAIIRRQRAALTRAVNSRDPAKVILAAQKAVSEWNQPGMAWPDDWSRWQRALDDVLPWNQRILLDDLPTMPAPDSGAPRPGDTAEQHAGATAETVTGLAQGKPAPPGDPELTAAPVNNGDLAAALRRLPGGEFARFVSAAGTPRSAGSRTSRRDGEPDASAHEALDWDGTGIDITISKAGIRRHGHVSWTQVASWIDPGMSPARLGLIITADQLSSFCHTARDKLIAAGKPDPDGSSRELAQIRDDAVSAVISAALSTRGSAAPIPPARSGQPSYQTAAMITRPDSAAGKDENIALQRLAQLRAAIREPQPASDADIKTTIRRWIGDGLPDYVRVLGKPAAMRDWINSQVTTRASRPVHVTYDTPGIPGGRWHGASPEGLLTAQADDDRAETLIRWEEIPAWIQPGINSERRDQLLAADDRHRAVIRRQLTAAALPGAIPGDQQDENQAARLRREAIDAAWAAIETASAPSPAQLEHARRAYHEDASPVQESLFGGPGPAGRQHRAGKPAADPAAPGQSLPAPAKPGPARQPARPAAASGNSAATPRSARQQDASAAGSTLRTARAAAQNRDGRAEGTARVGTGSSPLTSDDIFLSLRRLPILTFAELICAMDDGQPLASLTHYLSPYAGDRAADEADAGARETVTCMPQGMHVTVTSGSGTRTGQLGWPEVADWLRPGLSPGRLQIMRQAAQTRLRFMTATASFSAAGEADLAASTELELRNMISAAVGAALEAARFATAGKPAPAGQQRPRADDAAAALDRIGYLASALPAWPPQLQKPLSQVQAGDIIGHPEYKLQPFRVSAPPRHHDGVVEITGRLARPGDGEPAGEVTWTMTINGQADPPVRVVPVPARSLRACTPGRAEAAAGQQGPTQDNSGGRRSDDPQGQGTAARDPCLPRDARRTHARAAGDPTAGNAPSSGTRTSVSSDDMDVGQPHSIASATKEEDTMPPQPTAEPVPATEPPAAAEPGPAQAGPEARGAAAETRTADAPADKADEEARLLQKLDDVLTAISEHRRVTAQAAASAAAGFADIRAAFADLRSALELPADSIQPRPGNTVPSPAAGQPQRATTTARHARLAPEADDFDDIRAAFTALRQALDLPAQGQHSRTPGPNPGPPAPDAGSERLLDQAAAEAQACARWYRDTPEWQRITTVSRAAQDLITTIQQASGEYWAEIRQDIRVRSFVRTVSARTSLTVSGAAHILAGRLEKAGHKDTRIWRAAWGLHRATATFADRVMRYTPPRNPDRMDEVRQIINDLGQRPRRSRESSWTTDTRTRLAAAKSAADLGMEGFPAPVRPTAIQHASAPAARTAPPPLRHRHAPLRP